jgi:hypothetical protein
MDLARHQVTVKGKTDFREETCGIQSLLNHDYSGLFLGPRVLVNSVLLMKCVICLKDTEFSLYLFTIRFLKHVSCILLQVLYSKCFLIGVTRFMA